MIVAPEKTKEACSEVTALEATLPTYDIVPVWCFMCSLFPTSAASCTALTAITSLLLKLHEAEPPKLVNLL